MEARTTPPCCCVPTVNNLSETDKHFRKYLEDLEKKLAIHDWQAIHNRLAPQLRGLFCTSWAHEQALQTSWRVSRQHLPIPHDRSPPSHIQQRGLRCKVDQPAPAPTTQASIPTDAQQEMRRHGIDISKQTSRQLVRKDFERFDWILVMDRSNLANARELAGNNETHLAKIKLFVADVEVPDPYYGGAEGFSQVYNMVDAAAERWVESWQGDT